MQSRNEEALNISSAEEASHQAFIDLADAIAACNTLQDLVNEIENVDNIIQSQDPAATAAAAASIVPESTDTTNAPVPATKPDLQASSGCGTFNPFCIVPYVPAAAAAASYTVSDILGLYEAGNKSIPLLTGVSLIAFLSQLELSGESMTGSMKEIVDFFRHGKRPEGIPALSRKKMAAVISISTLFAIWSIISESMPAMDFMNATGKDYHMTKTNHLKMAWFGLSLLIAAGATFTKITTDNYQTLKILSQKLSDEPTHYANRTTQLITLLVGGSLSLTKSAYDSIQAYTIIRAMLGMESPVGRIALILPCLTDVISNQCFSGVEMMKGIEESCNYYREHKFEPPKIAAVTFSLLCAILLSFAKRPLNLSFCQDFAANDLGYRENTIPNEVFEAISWVIFTAEVLLVTVSLNPQVANLFTHLYNKIGDALNRLAQACSERDIESGEASPAPVSSNPAALFSKPKESSPHAAYCPPCVLI